MAILHVLNVLSIHYRHQIWPQGSLIIHITYKMVTRKENLLAERNKMPIFRKKCINRYMLSSIKRYKLKKHCIFPDRIGKIICFLIKKCLMIIKNSFLQSMWYWSSFPIGSNCNTWIELLTCLINRLKWPEGIHVLGVYEYINNRYPCYVKFIIF